MVELSMAGAGMRHPYKLDERLIGGDVRGVCSQIRDGRDGSDLVAAGAQRADEPLAHVSRAARHENAERIHAV
jgi:hypothetical protein